MRSYGNYLILVQTCRIVFIFAQCSLLLAKNLFELNRYALKTQPQSFLGAVTNIYSLFDVSHKK